MTDSASLQELEQEIAGFRFGLRFKDRRLEARFETARLRDARPYNRIALPLLIVIFDLFHLSDRILAPEIVTLSAYLRFAVLTPLTLLYLLLDWRGMLERWSGLITTALLTVPTLIVGVFSLNITSPAVALNFHAVPLIQLGAMTCRISVRQAAASVLISWITFAAILHFATFIPSADTAPLALTELAVGVAVIMFNLRLEMRDRQVFLLQMEAGIRRDLLAEQNRRLTRLSQVDALTGLGNRRRFDEALQGIWAAEQRQEELTVIMFDIDCFKRFNDEHGHQAGDECLRALARAVSGCVRKTGDVLVRYGGEEFAMLLPGTSLADGCMVAERVREVAMSCAIPHASATTIGVVTVSLGVATAVPAQTTPSALIEAADRALYCAKRAGRNRVAITGDCQNCADEECRVLSDEHWPPVRNGG
jgi:diguanylate cyclase (GGDEF)-like protein